MGESCYQERWNKMNINPLYLIGTGILFATFSIDNIIAKLIFTLVGVGLSFLGIFLQKTLRKANSK